MVEQTMEQPAIQKKTFVEKEYQDPFDLYIKKGKEKASQLLIDRFHNPSDPESKQYYHRLEHSQAVARRTVSAMEAMRKAIDPKNPEDPHLQISDKDIKLAELIAYWHDSVQGFSTINAPVKYAHLDPETGAALEKESVHMEQSRKRNLGINETQSFEELKAFMDSANKESGKEIFSAKDIETAHLAIMATVPTFDPIDGTVKQLGLREGLPAAAYALAFGDLGGPGIEGGDALKRDGMQLIREEQLDIPAFINEIDQMGDPAEKRGAEDYLKRRIEAYFARQITFVQNRRDRFFNVDLGFVPKPYQDALRNLFKIENYNASEKAAEDFHNQLKASDYQTVLKSVGFAS